MPDRLVRFTQSFFDRLDELLPASRGADGTPSATDFLLYELPRIRDLLARDFEANTLAVEEVPGVCVFIGTGVLVHAVALYAVIAADGAVEVIYLSIDRADE
jgi:hypothetical protein